VAEYEIPDDLRYSNEDEWTRVEGERAVVGVTDYAQQQLGDIVYVELPEVGATVEQGAPFGVIESVKAVSELYSPVSGKVLEINAELEEHPEWVNDDCYGDGWMIAVRVEEEEEVASLLDAKAYRKHVSDRTE
jgi:glycine cleavage system H protein